MAEALGLPPEVVALIPENALVWLALGVWLLRTVWPWLRDEYLAKQRDAMQHMVALGEQMEQRTQALEVRLDVVERLVSALIGQRLPGNDRPGH